MSTIENGGPAFPCDRITAFDGTEEKLISHVGMSLRDFAAIKAMQALIGHHGDVMHIVDGDSRTSLHAAAFDHADAFLKARI